MQEIDDSFEKMVRSLFESNKSGLPEHNIKFIDECIMYGESGVAYETLVDQLYEYDIPITKESYELIEKIGTDMNHQESYWLPLKELIIDK